jgi:hypothetical protein
VDSCEVCTDKRRAMVSPLALLAAVPLVGAPLYLRDKVMDQVELVAYDQRLAKNKPRPSRMPMAAAVATLLVAVGVAAVWDRDADIPGFPVALDLPPGSSLGSSAPPSSGATSSTESSTSSTTTTTTTTRPPTPGTTTTTATTTTTTTTTPPQPPADTVPPTIVRPLANPTSITVSPCSPTTTTVSATATDNVGVTSVTLLWNDPNGKPGSTGMKLQPNGRWQAPMGPFPVGTVRWRVTASDAAGNAATSPFSSLDIQDCIR